MGFSTVQEFDQVSVIASKSPDPQVDSTRPIKVYTMHSQQERLETKIGDDNSSNAPGR